jgi:hypothetical protein
MPRQFVRCCSENQGEEGDNIWFDEDNPCFRYAGDDKPFEYCPWCGVLLDWNLPMTDEHP